VIQPCDPSPESLVDNRSVAQLRELIQTKKFKGLEDALDDRLKRYEAGQYSDLALFLLIDGAVSPADASFDPILTQWIAERPRHLMARIVRANYHIGVAYKKRGSAVANQTSSEQFAAMDAEFAKAFTDLKVALEIRPNSPLAIAGLILIARATGDRSTVLGWIEEAERRDPANLSARWVAIKALDQRWVGDPEDIDLLVERAMKAPLASARRRTLQWKAEMTQGDYFYSMSKENTKAIVHYRKAASLCASSDALWKSSSAAYELENWAVVIDSVSEYLVQKPDAQRAYARRGWAKESLNRLPDAVSDYEKAAALGDDWAQNKLGYLLMTGNGVNKDIPRARKLFEAAAAQGNRHAPANLASIR
jgi:tetratricopeptide (TPR) repeat protein